MTRFDFLIVGSGAAGAAAAWRLTSKGYKVACIERGDWIDPSEYPTTSVDWEIKKKTFSPVISERQNIYDYPVNDKQSPIALCNFNAVGGSTILYSGHFPRFQPRDFQINTMDGISEDWPIKYQSLKKYFEINEYQMSVSGLTGDPYYPDIHDLLPPIPLGKVGVKLAKAFNSKGWHWWPSYAAISTRNTRERSACINLGPCNTGCPQGAKSSTDITYVQRAISQGLVLITKAAVFEIIVEHNRAVGVRYHDEHANIHEISARHVILAASAIGTPRILLNSRENEYPHGLGNSSGLLGCNLMLHPLGYVEGLFKQEYDVDIGPQGCMLFSLENYRSKNSDFKLGYMMQALRGSAPVETALTLLRRRQLRFGSQLYSDFYSYFRKQLSMTVVCEDLPEKHNCITLNHEEKDRFGIPGITIRYRLNKNTKLSLSHGLKAAKSLMKEAGAITSFAYGPVRNAGWHVMGTAKMGKNPKNSVVNPIGKLHDLDGLYIVDSSVFVTGSCVNPANTIQSVALYLTDRIERHARYET